MSADPRDPLSSTHRLAPALDSAEAISGRVQAARAALADLDAERAAPTLPGTIPDLLRRCSPVLVTFEAHVSIAGVVLLPGVVAVRDGGLSDIYEVGESEFDDIHPEQVALDLTDATGRAHAAWWLGGVGASFHLACDGHRRWELHGGERPRESALRAWEGIGPDARRLRGVPPEYGWDAEDVPALAALDPNDPRILPDGSRLVDALALSLVGRHLLAGGGK